MSETTLYYITDYTDEVMPCKATLDGWAEWLSAPNEDWGRPEAAKDGETFMASTMTRHENIEARWEGDVLMRDRDPPATADFFVPCYDGGGWDACDIAQTMEEAVPRDFYGESPVTLACCSPGSSRVLRFVSAKGDEPAAMIDEGPAQ